MESFVHPGPISVALFLVVVFSVLNFVLIAVDFTNRSDGDSGRRRTRRVALGVFATLGVFSAVVGSGLPATDPTVWVPALFLGCNALAVAFAFSAQGRKLALWLPWWALVAFQAFRLPLELVLHDWVEVGTIPPTMTWTGSNFDILTGFAAILVALFGSHSRRMVWAFAVLGSVLLANVARVAVMSSPLPFAWSVTPPLALALHLPYAWILPVCVGGALFGHLVLFRALHLRR